MRFNWLKHEQITGRLKKGFRARDGFIGGRRERHCFPFVMALCLAMLPAMTTGVMAEVPLSLLNGTDGFAVEGDSLLVKLGTDVASVGDVNGDGYDDFIVARQFVAITNVTLPQDTCYVIFGDGGAFPPTIDVSTLDGTNGFRLTGLQITRTEFGLSVAGAGDVNGDGFNDIIVGAPSAPKSGSPSVISGQAYIIYGRDDWPSSMNAGFLFGSFGTVINGINHGDGVGTMVASAGDVNGDGYDDVIVHAHNTNNPFLSYATYIIFGKSQLVSDSLAPFELASINGQNGFSISGTGYFPPSEHPLFVAGAGDVNGDGYDDVAIAGIRGAPFYDAFGYVAFGRGSNFATVVNPAELTGPNGFRFNVAKTSPDIIDGLVVASAGDVNSDGYADIIIGPGTTTIATLAEYYVIFGKQSWGAAAINAPTDLDGELGTTLRGVDSFIVPHDGRVAGAGDVDGDGYSDLLFGSPAAPGNGILAGRTYLMYGKPSWSAVTPVTEDLNAEVGVVYVGSDNEFAGYMASAGDFNNDGFMDIVIGGPRRTYGKAFFVYGTGDTAGSATYKSRTRGGNSVQTAVGIPGTAGDGTAPSRVWLDFNGGTHSLEQATITRSKTGLSGFARPEEVADIHWQVSTDRTGWTSAEMTLKYTDASIANLPGAEANLHVYSASSPTGPWTREATTADPSRKTLSITVAGGQFGYYAIGTETANEASVDEWALY